MYRFAIWTALEVEGLGASLQHHSEYAEPINGEILKAFELPGTYKVSGPADALRAAMWR